MHDLSYFREHLDVFADMAKKRSMTLDLDGFRLLDKERRELITTNERRKAERNRASEEIARLKKEKKSADALIAEMKQASDQIKEFDGRIAELDRKQRDLLLAIPNVKGAALSFRSDGLYLQFRKGRLTGWKGDWGTIRP